MIDPKEYIVVIPPKKGDCYVCGKKIDELPSLQVQANVPLTKFKKVMGRSCVPCAAEFRAFLDLKISQAQRGDY
jgi:hypothetical protein